MHPNLRMRMALFLGLAVAALGCAAGPGPIARKPAEVAARTPPGVATSPVPATGLVPSADIERLRAVYAARTGSGSVQDTPIGPGDLVEVDVPAMEELQSKSVRVSATGTISLPLLGTMHAAGLTENELHRDLQRRLGEYMHRPQLSLLVKEYRSRQVGVLGAVAEPGLHTASGAGSTILDMISEAGGLTDQASQRLLFIPVENVDDSEAGRLASSGQIAGDAAPRLPLGARPAAQLLKASSPIVIDLEKMNDSSQQMALSVPVRPGDTIIALGGGQVFVQGWVDKPGAYPLTRGLTLLGAMAAAGGPTYPADKTSVRVLRDAPTGEREVIHANVEDVEAGRADDVLMREGDIIEVESTGGKLAAYGVYHFFTNVMRMGFALSPF